MFVWAQGYFRLEVGADEESTGQIWICFRPRFNTNARLHMRELYGNQKWLRSFESDSQSESATKEPTKGAWLLAI